MKISIFHFNPIEWYPPAMNFLACLEKNLPENSSVKVYTSSLSSRHMTFEIPSNRIEIIRHGNFRVRKKPLGRYFQYFKYYFFSTVSSIHWKPDKILYYETLSAPTAYVLMKLFKNLKVFVHFHEYMTPEEYKRTWLNKKIYCRV